MFHFITWGEYFISVAIVLAVYYVLLATFCYRREIADLIKGETKRRKKNPIENNGTEDLRQVVREVKGILRKAGKEAGKSELLMQLKERLASFAGLRQPACRVALTNYIVRYAKTFCGVVFSEQELEELSPPDGGEI